MDNRRTTHTPSDHDLVMSWMQQCELKDPKLGAARGGKVRSVDISTAIERMQDKARLAFPGIDPKHLDALVRHYIDPLGLSPARTRGIAV